MKRTGGVFESIELEQPILSINRLFPLPPPSLQSPNLLITHSHSIPIYYLFIFDPDLMISSCYTGKNWQTTSLFWQTETDFYQIFFFFSSLQFQLTFGRIHVIMCRNHWRLLSLLTGSGTTISTMWWFLVVSMLWRCNCGVTFHVKSRINAVNAPFMIQVNRFDCVIFVQFKCGGHLVEAQTMQSILFLVFDAQVTTDRIL